MILPLLNLLNTKIHAAIYTLASDFVITDVAVTRTFDWTLSLATGGV